MQELLGRLQSLDPQAGAELRIVAHFDALVAGRVGLVGLLRAAVTLSGCAAGFHDHHRVLRIDRSGGRHDHGVRDRGFPTRPVPGLPAAVVWLERTGPAQPADEMVLERLALAVEIVERRRTDDAGTDRCGRCSTRARPRPSVRKLSTGFGWRPTGRRGWWRCRPTVPSRPGAAP